MIEWLLGWICIYSPKHVVEFCVRILYLDNIVLVFLSSWLFSSSIVG